MLDAAQDRYRMVQVSTSSPTRLVAMMCEGAARFFGQASASISNGDSEGADYWLGRACAIIHELLGTLDFQAGKDVARHLGQIYTMTLREAMRAKLGRDATALSKLQSVFTDLRNDWIELAGRQSC